MTRTALGLLTVLATASAAGAQAPPDTPPLVVPPPDSPPPPPPPPPVDFLSAPPRFAPRPSESGLFTGLDVALVFPEVRTRHGSDLGGRPTDFGLDTNVSPTFTVGYNLPGGLSSIFASYRYLGADGHPDLQDFGMVTARTRLDVNDFTFAFQRRFEPSDRWQFSVTGGARLASIYYDLDVGATITDLIDTPPIRFDLRGSSHFVGAGPMIGLGAERRFGPGLGVFGTTDFAALFGRQTFRTAAEGQTDGFPPFFMADSESHGRTVEALRLQTGLNWQPASTPHMQFQFGYQFEYFWNVGRFADATDDLMINGLFARLRVTY